MREIVLTACAVPLLLVSPVLAAQAPGQPGEFVRRGTFAGTVVMVTASSLTLDGEGVRNFGGEKLKGVKTFPASNILSQGGFPTDRSPGSCYRLRDLRPGDEVHIWFFEVGGADVVHYINFSRRPGGRVPPSPAEKPGATGRPHHVSMNEANDLQEIIEPALAKIPPALRARLELQASIIDAAQSNRRADERIARSEIFWAVFDVFNGFSPALRPGGVRVPPDVDLYVRPPIDEDEHLWKAQRLIDEARVVYKAETGKNLDVPDVFRRARGVAPPPRLVSPKP